MNIKDAVFYLAVGFFALSLTMALVAVSGSAIFSWLIYIPTCFVFGVGVMQLWRSAVKRQHKGVV